MSKIRIIVLSLIAIIFAASCCENCCKKECCKKECCKKECCKCKEHRQMGIQLYSVRELIGNPDLFAQNADNVLAQIAGMGYKSIEAANYDGNGHFYGLAAKEFKATVEKHGMQMLSSHVGHNLTAEMLAGGDITPALEQVKNNWVPDHKAAGASYIVVPWFAVPATLAELDVICKYLDECGKICKENGITFGYHNHSHEFQKVEDQVMYDYMIEHTNPDFVCFEMDVFWATQANASPVAYFKRYPGRFSVLHIKDVTEVGQSGMVGFDAIFGADEISGAQNYIVEMEGSAYGDILRTCQESIDYLKKF